MKKSFYIVAGLSALSVLTYCSSNYFGRALTRNSSNAPAVVTQECTTGDNCTIVNKFDPQPTQAGKFWPEIVFIGDTSPSMTDNYTAIANSLSQWLSHLQAEGIENFCVGYMPAHAGQYSGLYYAPSGYPKCMCFGDYGVDDIVTKMSYILQHAPTKDLNANGSPTYSQNGEVPLYSLHNAITDSAKTVANQDAGCMRNDYTFVPILVGDENDIIAAGDGTDTSAIDTKNQCDRFIDGVQISTVQFDNSVFPVLKDGFTTGTANKNEPNYNPLDSVCEESTGRFLYYSNHTVNGGGKYDLIMTPESVSNELVSYNGALPTFGTGVGFKAGDQPVDGFNGQDGPFWGGIEFASQFGQDIANLKYAGNDQDKFDTELNNIADALAKTVTFHYVFDLRDENGSSSAVCETKLDSLVVKVDGKTVSPDDYTLSSNRSRVTFDKAYDWSFADVVTITFETC